MVFIAYKKNYINTISDFIISSIWFTYKYAWNNAIKQITFVRYFSRGSYRLDIFTKYFQQGKTSNFSKQIRKNYLAITIILINIYLDFIFEIYIKLFLDSTLKHC